VINIPESEFFVNRVKEIIREMEIPLIDEQIYEDVSSKSKNALATVIFTFEEDEAVIRGFLGLADYFHTVVIKDEDVFYIPHSSILFILKTS
jgi:hypothetical protein